MDALNHCLKHNAHYTLCYELLVTYVRIELVHQQLIKANDATLMNEQSLCSNIPTDYTVYTRIEQVNRVMDYKSECIGHAGTSSDALDELARTERRAVAVTLTRRRLQLFASFHSTRARTHQYKQATGRSSLVHNTCHAQSN
ncbi:hypothetical protein HW555_007955 [Spodoptera exigua]|uniref:Uncharacterized protein n=1 Tax=Spodoptera exigua TaxID=7107 RepID=A0A835GFT4_SPOEX|nr:hypothetical protein HW555_007955 [Spodoptera exigua]